MAEQANPRLKVYREPVEEPADAGPPPCETLDVPGELAPHWEAILRGGAESIGCQAVALYLLDAQTTTLKLRAGWGLADRRSAELARPLRGAIADLEALCGHAVVLEAPTLFEHWRVPEGGFQSAVCVPVSSPTVPLGTLWMYCDRARHFSDEQTGVIQAVASRLATELEQQRLLDANFAAADLRQQAETARRSQRNRLPAHAPLVDAWDVAGWCGASEAPGGSFFDWFQSPDGSLAVIAGDVHDDALEALLYTAAIRAAVRAHGRHDHDAATLLAGVNQSLWEGSCGDRTASMFYGLLDEQTGRVRFAAAGSVSAVVLSPDGFESLGPGEVSLGVDPGANFDQRFRVLAAGEVLFVHTGGGATPADGKPALAADLRHALAENSAAPASRLMEVAAGQFQREQSCTPPAVLILRHRG